MAFPPSLIRRSVDRRSRTNPNFDMFLILFVAAVVYSSASPVPSEASASHTPSVKERYAVRHCCSDLPEDDCCMDAIKDRKPLKCDVHNRTAHQERTDCLSKAIHHNSLDLLSSKDSSCCDLEKNLQYSGAWSTKCHELVNIPATRAISRLRSIKKEMNNTAIYDCFLRCKAERRTTSNSANETFNFSVEMCNIQGLMATNKEYVGKELQTLYATEALESKTD